jgi:hypothetical protein
MAVTPWKVSQEVATLIEKVKVKHHHPRLETASITACFQDGKAFIKNKMNLGKVLKFSPFNKLWQIDKHDFCLLIPSSLWNEVLKTPEQKEAYIDLQLTRCEVEYEAQTAEENGKKIKIKDEYGRIQYTDQMKTDDEGNVKWKVLPLAEAVGLEVFSSNVRRYGTWLDSIEELKEAIDEAKTSKVSELDG